MPIFGIFGDFLPGSYRAKIPPQTPFLTKILKKGVKIPVPGVPVVPEGSRRALPGSPAPWEGLM